MDLRKPYQLDEIAGNLQSAPDWFIACGVGSGGEAFAAKRIWPDCKVLGFEPSPTAYDAMSSTFPGMLLQKAVWLRRTELKMWAHDTLLFGNLFGVLVDRGTEYSNVRPGSTDVILVQTETLDQASDEIGPFTNVFLWIDVEYAEIAVMIGARKLFESSRIIAVNFENHPVSVDPDKSLVMSELLSMYGLSKVLEYGHEGGHHWDELWETTDAKI